MQLSGIDPSPLSSTDVMFSIEQELIPIQTILQDCFSRVETKLSAMSYFQGLISTIERKNSWQLAEQAGCAAGAGSKGQRYYQWARMMINSDSPNGWERWLLIRRNIKDPNEVAFYIKTSCGSERDQPDYAVLHGPSWTTSAC